MKAQYHILNGDSLKEQFPSEISGEIIIARECLVDGNVHSKDIDGLFKIRAEFISKNYPAYTEGDYFQKTVTEFTKVQNIPIQADINLWFEDDLFCQVNFWFVTHLLVKSNHHKHIYLIRPDTQNQYGFAGLNKADLISVYKKKTALSDLNRISSLWDSYQSNDIKSLLKTSRLLKDSYPFIFNAVSAHIDRIPSKGKLGKPTESLIQIMKELGTDDFEKVFQEFNQREHIYGFGDLQVKRLLDEIKKSNTTL